jgi:hypothetical protein
MAENKIFRVWVKTSKRGTTIFCSSHRTETEMRELLHKYRNYTVFVSEKVGKRMMKRNDLSLNLTLAFKG